MAKIKSKNAAAKAVSESEKVKLLKRAAAEYQSGDEVEFVIVFGLKEVLAVIGFCQLALRNPEAAKRPSAKVARRIINAMIENLDKVGLHANADVARLGDYPEFD